MRNPFARQPAPTAATLHAQQQIATLQGQLQQAQAMADYWQQQAQLARIDAIEAQKNYRFYFDEYRRTCNAGGKHQ